MTEITVVIPIYNQSEFIKKCLDSVLSQSFKNITIKVINDGSTDNLNLSWYQGIELINQKNIGLIKTVNQQIQQCTTKYFTWLAADNWLSPNCYTDLYTCAEKNQADFVYGGYTFVTTHGCRVKDVVILPQNNLMENNDVGTSWLIKTNLAQKYLLDEKYKHAHDYKLWLDVLVNGGKICTVSNNLGFMRSHVGRQSQTGQWKDNGFGSMIEEMIELRNIYNVNYRKAYKP